MKRNTAAALLAAACLSTVGCAATSPSRVDRSHHGQAMDFARVSQQLLKGAKPVAAGHKISYGGVRVGMFYLVDARTGEILQTKFGNSFDSESNYENFEWTSGQALPARFKPVLYYRSRPSSSHDQ